MLKNNENDGRQLFLGCQWQWPMVVLLLVLTACVPGAKLPPPGEPLMSDIVVEDLATPIAEKPMRGVVITEKANLDSAARQEFDQAVAMLLAGEFDAAIALLEPLVEAGPGVTAPYIDLAIVYRKRDQLERAEELLKKALELVPGHPVASNEYGLLLRSVGRFSEARDVYGNSLELYPDYLPVRRNLGILCDLYLNDMECAFEQYSYYSAARPDDQQVALWVSELQMRLGQ